jgi:hypothetical protein
MGETNRSVPNLSGAALFSAALVVFIVLAWLLLGQVRAQSAMQIRGQLVNGTHDAPAHAIENVPITLFQITAAGPVTRTAPTDAQGKFTFADVITDANAYFLRVDYANIRYFSEIRPPELAAASPFTVSVYETQTLPANFTLDRVHLILDVQPRRFNGLELVQVTNPSDRVFMMPLPLPDRTSDVQFQDIREQSIVKREDDGTILYPILPTTSEILFGVIIPYTPPEYRLQIPLLTNVGGFNLLVSQTSGVSVAGSNLTAGAPFTSQSGQPYAVFWGPDQRAGTTFSATISNLPGADNTRQLQTIVVLGGGLSALALLAYPIYRQRVQQSKRRAPNERLAQLQALAQLDDAFDAGELEEGEYHAQRARLKAELLKNAREQESQAESGKREASISNL